jgi:biopolymer transport protein ExbB
VLCALLFVLSIVVMATKTLTIGAIRRENEAFLTAFRAADARGPAAGGSPDGMRALAASSAKGAAEYPASSLFRLYELGLSETERRTVGAPSGIVLSEQTMQAIRAALHAANIRSSQKLNSGMVLLTLAISGGPFLGLLGTVLGVMITFAAIAHTGEVDVAAIAPGTAAALAATVAGLAVAIPALFGYNYLTIRIREITAENDVFLDEFVTRVAEQYS